MAKYLNARTKLKVICPIHGMFETTPNTHIYSKCGCLDCGNKKIGDSLRMSKAFFCEKAKLMHGDKYDYSKVEYRNSMSDLKIICPAHGEFIQRAGHHLAGCGCPKCAIEKNSAALSDTTKSFKFKARLIHSNKYDYSKVEYSDSYSKVCIICPKHGEFWQSPNAHLAGHNCPNCHVYYGEKKISDFLETNGYVLNKTYFREKTFPGLKSDKKRALRYDFYIPNKKLLIEFNGYQHYVFPSTYCKNFHSFLYQKHNDWLKRKYAKNTGLKLLTISYRDYNLIENILTEEL